MTNDKELFDSELEKLLRTPGSSGSVSFRSTMAAIRWTTA